MKKIIALFLLFNLVFIDKSVFYLSARANFATDSLRRTYYNIVYPKRLINSLLQRDMKGAEQETKRFLINSFLEAIEIFDFAHKIFNFELILCLLKLHQLWFTTQVHNPCWYFLLGRLWCSIQGNHIQK